MIFNREKNLLAWNNDVLDTYHDIVVSFDYARYSTTNVPAGGFCISFFEDDADVPTLGGPGFSLGYTPNEQSDYCYLKGYQGMKGGFLGIGFDSLGFFGTNTTKVDGLSAPVPNSCTIRDSEANNFRHIVTSKNLTFIYRNKNFYISEKVPNTQSATYKTIKVIISRAFTNIEVLVKYAEEKEFVSVLKHKIPIRRRTGVRVGLTCATEENDSKFFLKNFNVTGFPGKKLDPELSDCAYIERNQAKLPGNTIVSSRDFVAIPVDGGINVYELRSGEFRLKQILVEDKPIVLLGGNDRFLFTGDNKSTEVGVFYKANDKFLYTGLIDLLSFEEVDPIILKDHPPVCADTDSKRLAIGNKKNVFLYEFVTGVGDFGFGAFSPTQTLMDNPSGDIGYQVQIDGTKLLTSGGTPRLGGRYNSFVSYYSYKGQAWSELPEQTFASPQSGNFYDEFGQSIVMVGNEAIIGSPNEFRRRLTTVGHGEAYHYVFTRSRTRPTNEWRVAMGLGSFYNIDCPGGNFGTHVNYYGNNLIVSAPYENYHFPPDLTLENIPNCGRIYIFRKNRGGTFSQAAIIAPDFDRAKPNMYLGRLVGLLGRSTAVATVPYKNNLLYTPEIDVYKIGCIFPTPPRHLPINKDSIALYDNSGYTIDIETFTYLQLLNYPKDVEFQ